MLNKNLYYIKYNKMNTMFKLEDFLPYYPIYNEKDEVYSELPRPYNEKTNKHVKDSHAIHNLGSLYLARRITNQRPISTSWYKSKDTSDEPSVDFAEVYYDNDSEKMY